MADARSQFRRAVLGLHHHPSKRGLSLAVEVARLLDLDLFGLFVEDEGLLHLAALPFVREFSPLGGGWRAIERERLAGDLQSAARTAQRLFADAVKGMARSCEFGIVRGSMAEAIAAHTRAGDIIVLSAPATAGEYPAKQFPRLIETALHSAAGVLLVPRQIAREAGDVVAIAAAPDDASIRLAAAIARAAKEELVIVELFDAGEGDTRTSEEVRPTRRTASRVAASDPSMLIAAFRSERERLVVITHGATDPTLPTILASWRRVPVLVIAPERPADEDAGAAGRDG
ncbi:MAG TPA: hypothetical protein VLX44_08405 [Xanthobacteraceae bacterium]|nr:hypothetical protein [Xanthobacteraceae bacterium]